MKNGLKSWPAIALLLGVALGAEARDNDLAKAPSDQAQWVRLIGSVKGMPEDRLLNFQSVVSTATANGRFYVAEAECSANAVALLNINDLLLNEAKSVRLTRKTVWSNKTVILLRRDYVDGQDFLFLCLVDKNGKLERTRLLRPELRNENSAVEIDAAKYIYRGK